MSSCNGEYLKMFMYEKLNSFDLGRLKNWFVTLITSSTLGLFTIGQAHSQTPGYTEIEWQELMPAKWLKEAQEAAWGPRPSPKLQDGTPEADEAMAKARKHLDEAPVSKARLGQKVRIAGYVVPLDAVRNQKREFLLVPYFGACIHVPPPPANQIILIQPTKSSKMKQIPESMSVVWVEGKLQEARVPTSAGVSGYALETDNVYPWVLKDKK
jgi:uncharacterized protein